VFIAGPIATTGYVLLPPGLKYLFRHCLFGWTTTALGVGVPTRGAVTRRVACLRFEASLTAADDLYFDLAFGPLFTSAKRRACLLRTLLSFVDWRGRRLSIFDLRDASFTGLDFIALRRSG